MSKFLPTQIAVVGAACDRLPDNAVHWSDMRSVGTKVRNVLTAADETISAIESDKNLSVVGSDALRKKLAKEILEDLKKLKTPSSAVERRTKLLSDKVSAAIDAHKPKDATEATFHAEVRKFIADSESPTMTATSLRSDSAARAAVINSPHWLLKMTAEEHAAVKAKMLEDTPESHELAEIAKARRTCDGAVDSAIELLVSRAGLRKGINGDYI